MQPIRAVKHARNSHWRTCVADEGDEGDEDGERDLIRPVLGLARQGSAGVAPCLHRVARVS
jgi:hypothetical protein